MEPAGGADEQDLVRRARDGDRKAFDALIRMHQDTAFALAHRMVGDYTDAHDVAQEAFVRAFLGISGFRGRSSFRTWLYSILINVSRNRLKARNRQRSRFVSMQAEDPLDTTRQYQYAGTDPGPDIKAERGELYARIKEAIARLPVDQREVVLLRDVHGMSYEEVAQATGCAAGTVKSRLHRARSQLQDQLRSLIDDEVPANPPRP